jgi:soluble lytic murein transglycosylase
MKFNPSISYYAAIAGLATGLAIGTVRGADDVRRALPTVDDIQAALPVNPIPVFTDAELALAVDRTREHLAADRPWAAWHTIAGHAGAPERAPETVVLLAARAAAGWDGWAQVRGLLEGREWLDRYGRGEGLLLLARAHEEREAWNDAAALYQRFLAVRDARTRPLAAARLGRVLTEAGHHARAAEAYGIAAAEASAARDWFAALQAQALRQGNDPEAVVPLPAEPASAPARIRHARAEAALWRERGDVARALERVDAEWHALARTDGSGAAAPLGVERAKLLDALQRTDEARDQLRQVAGDAGAVPAVRMEAATALGELVETRTAAEELARAAAYEAGRRPGLAARALRGALRAGAPDDAATRLRLGMLLFDERDFGPARTALLDAAPRLADAEQAAAAELAAARALVRLGRADAGFAELRRVAETRPGTAAAGTAHFLVGDAAPSNAAAIPHYRRAAAIPTSPDAREALYRVGHRSLREGDRAAALSAWEEYLTRYPRGEQAAEAAYHSGVIHERAGRTDRARQMYAAAIAADPISYHAIRAGDRSGLDPLAGILTDAQPAGAAAAQRAEAARVLRRLAVLEEAGLEREWREELDAQLHRLDANPAALLAIAEGLRDAGHAIEGIRLGRRLLERRGWSWDDRLLRLVFPFLYRDLIEQEARRHDVDPFLFAALVRQESSFNPRARSWVGASGLAQVMPATGRWLAPAVGIDDFDVALLEVPEVSVRMGTRYLRDQLRRYNGSRDLALAAYNAGPGRADRWRRELGYGRDVDAFREAIPFSETRHYVKVVVRNAVVYRHLYGADRRPGLVATGS